MPFSKAFNVISFIDHTIRNGSAKTVTEIADTLEISERQVFNYIRAMKRIGAPITYNRSSKRYSYKESGFFYIGFLKNK
ncbi:MAG: HTH domain-containing protein [Bacteroidales bacterium]|nr:HTH domain-containing protein [Bacteroidales bacterium]